MPPRSAAANEVARRLWDGAAGDSKTPEEIAAAADRMCAQLYAGLGLWVGAMGYRTLLDRALALLRPEHPVLSSLACFGGDQRVSSTAAEVSAGMVAVVATLIESLGRIIGEEMAVRLVEQTGVKVEQTGKRVERTGTENERERERERPSPRGVVSGETQKDRARAES
jgi:hypothetical protein